MDSGKKLGIICALLILMAGVSVALQFWADDWLNQSDPESLTPAVETGISATFASSDFRYGPQDFRPYKEPLNITPEGGGEWYMMFVRLNATPYGGNPYLGRRGAVRIHYTFENLAGQAAFHVIGFQAYPAKCRTNRQDGYGASELVVTGTGTPGKNHMDNTPLAGPNNNLIVPAGVSVEPDMTPAVSYLLHFNQFSGGQDALHITSDPEQKKGSQIQTTETQGTFYITHTGGSVINDILLLCAVDTIQSDSFRVTLHSSFIREDEF